MPRVKINRTQYKLTDFSKWIRHKMLDAGSTQTDLADLIHVSQSQISRKLNKSSFDLEETIIILNYFKAEPEEIEKLMLY